MLFEREGINYIPVENVQAVEYTNGTYYIQLKSDGILILKLKG